MESDTSPKFFSCMQYKRSYFQTSQPIYPGIILCSSFRSNKHILLKDSIFGIYSGNNADLKQLQELHPHIFKRLIEGGFLIPKDSNELDEWVKFKYQEVNDQSFYQVIINPTLDCNLSCWYCYETYMNGFRQRE